MKAKIYVEGSKEPIVIGYAWNRLSVKQKGKKVVWLRTKFDEKYPRVTFRCKVI